MRKLTGQVIDDVQNFVERIRGFWVREEVPRWMGFCLLALFAISLALTAWTALLQANKESSRQLARVQYRALECMGGRLGSLAEADISEQGSAIRDISSHLGCSELRVIDGQRKVVVSARPEEVGTTRPTDPNFAGQASEWMEVVPLGLDAEGRSRSLFRFPISVRGQTAIHFVEGVLTSSPEGSLWTNQTATMWVMAGAIAVFLGLYRLMRKHYRGMACIADHLEAKSDALSEQIESLRVADSLGALAQTWNTLIDLVVELQDKTQRSTASAELKEALQRSSGGELAEVLNALPDALIHVTDGSVLRYFNSKAVHLLGWNRPKDEDSTRVSLDDIEAGRLGRKFVDAIRELQGPDGSFRSAVKNVEDEEHGSTYRLRVLSVRRGRADECLVVMTDISQQVRADRSREEFVSQVTHELRTPLTNIRAYAETLSSGMFDDPKVVTDCYNVITKETRRLSRLIEDILSISQIEAGSMQLLEDVVDVRALVSEAVRDVRGLADEKKIDLQMDLSAKLGTTQGDRDKLAVVLNNLLGNALKYTPSGGSVHLGCKMSETEMLITVKDTGLGISAEDQTRIFEKFQRADDPDVQLETGTGIGLTTAREIARRHGGDIEVMSEKGQGATFVMRMPVKNAAPAVVLHG